MPPTTIIYLHGFATLGGLQNRTANFLHQQCDAYGSVDFHAIDFNPTPRDFQFHTITGMIDRLRVYILNHELGSINLIGSSQGANVALNYAHKYGNVEKLLLLAPELQYDSYSTPEELAEWEALVAAPVFHYGFEKEINLDFGHHQDGLRYVTPPPPPAPITIIHGTRDKAIPIERSASYATRYSEHVKLLRVDDGHRLLGQDAFIWQQATSFFEL